VVVVRVAVPVRLRVGGDGRLRRLRADARGAGRGRAAGGAQALVVALHRLGDLVGLRRDELLELLAELLALPRGGVDGPVGGHRLLELRDRDRLLDLTQPGRLDRHAVALPAA
jgi:hypothetical protein